MVQIKPECLKVGVLRPNKNWAKVPDDKISYHPYEAEDSSVWCPLVTKDTVRSDIRLAKRSCRDQFADYGSIGRFDTGMWGIANEYNPFKDWILHINDHVLLVGNDRNTLQDIFNHQYRWRFVRPPAMKLIPCEDEIEEVLSSVVRAKDAKVGDFVLRYHLGPVLDVALINKVNRSRTKFGIVGDTVTLGPSEFVPPTKKRKNEYIDGIKRLLSPIATSLPNDPQEPTYPEHQSNHIPGRPDLKLNVISGRRTDRYVYFDFEIENQGSETVNWLHYEWARDADTPKYRRPFSYLDDTFQTVFSVSTHGYSRTLYPNSSEKISVCVGKDLSAGQLKVYIPAYYFAGCAGSFFRLDPEV